MVERHFMGEEELGLGETWVLYLKLKRKVRQNTECLLIKWAPSFSALTKAEVQWKKKIRCDYAFCVGFVWQGFSSRGLQVWLLWEAARSFPHVRHPVPANSEMDLLLVKAVSLRPVDIHSGSGWCLKELAKTVLDRNLDTNDATLEK